MKNLLFALVILFCSCHCDWYNVEGIKKPTMAEEYYWYFDEVLLSGVDSCQVVGLLHSEYDDKDVYSINRKCKVFHDTLYVEKRRIAGHHNCFDGCLYINDREYRVSVGLK